MTTIISTHGSSVVKMKEPIRKAAEHSTVSRHVRAQYLDGGWLSVVGDTVQRVQSRKLAWQGTPTQFINLCCKYGLTQESFRVYRVTNETDAALKKRY